MLVVSWSRLLRPLGHIWGIVALATLLVELRWLEPDARKVVVASNSVNKVCLGARLVFLRSLLSSVPAGHGGEGRRGVQGGFRNWAWWIVVISSCFTVRLFKELVFDAEMNLLTPLMRPFNLHVWRPYGFVPASSSFVLPSGVVPGVDEGGRGWNPSSIIGSETEGLNFFLDFVGRVLSVCYQDQFVIFIFPGVLIVMCTTIWF